MERRVEVCGVGVHLSAGLKEEDDDVDVAEAGGDVKGRLLFLKTNEKRLIIIQVHFTILYLTLLHCEKYYIQTDAE